MILFLSFFFFLMKEMSHLLSWQPKRAEGSIYSSQILQGKLNYLQHSPFFH